MRLWRLTRRPFADLEGRGVARFGGRWNRPGRPMVYTAAEVNAHLEHGEGGSPKQTLLLQVGADRARTSRCSKGLVI